MKPTYQRRPIEVTLSEHAVFVLESHHAPDFRMAAQCHDFLEIFYVVEGAGTFHIDHRPHPCRKGDIVVVPVGGLHRIEDEPATPLVLYGICIAPRVWQQEPALLDHLPAGRLSISKLLAAQVRTDLRRMLFEQMLVRPGSRTLILGLAQQLLALLAQSRLIRNLAPQPPGASRRSPSGSPSGSPSRSASRRVGKAGSSPDGSASSPHRQGVHRYVAELPHRLFEATGLDQIAAELHMSRRRFTELFRLETGTSWSAYLIRLRVDYACQLLRETPRGIIAVAFECGFEDLSSFYRAFKRQMGVPPGAWRERQTGE